MAKFASEGTAIRGDREMDQGEADVVRRIYEDYARGLSPKKIAEALNLEKVPGPQGGHWGTSIIHSNRERGTGILNNDLYIGRQVWNRLGYVKEPAPGGFSTIAKDRFGCSNSRNKGTSVCANRTDISRQHLEGRILPCWPSG